MDVDGAEQPSHGESWRMLMFSSGRLSTDMIINIFTSLVGTLSFLPIFFKV